MFGKYLSTMCWGFNCCGIWCALSLTLQGGGDTLTLDSAVLREAQWVDAQIQVPVPVVPQAPVENPIAGATPP